MCVRARVRVCVSVNFYIEKESEKIETKNTEKTNIVEKIYKKLLKQKRPLASW